jgi:general secretion pathway protein A
MAHVSDPPSKRWDDPNVPASLNDPDRDLDESEPAPLVPPGTFGDPNDPPPPLTFTRPEPGDARARRPLLELFPLAASESKLAPMPTKGTAVGPQLPPRRPRSSPGTVSPSLKGLTYETFYGLREKPFSLSTDPKFEFRSAEHARASRELLDAIGARRGHAVLTGALGMGKTTLCRAMLQEIDRRTVTSLVLEPRESLDELLRTMLGDFGVVAREDLAGGGRPTLAVMVSALNAFLASLAPLQAGAVVFIDEAQHVPASVLGELDALCRVGSGETRVLQLVMVGQPALTARLESPETRTLNGSVSHRVELGSLAAGEIAPYVKHRLSVAGANTRVEFDEAAITLLFALSGGSPRTVNLLCERALTRGRNASAAVIDRALVDAAAADLDLDTPAPHRPRVIGKGMLAAVFALLVLAGAAAALWVSRDAVSRTVLQWEQVPPPPAGPERSLPPPLTPIPSPTDAPSEPKPLDAPR